jgi:hypothetical protein
MAHHADAFLSRLEIYFGELEEPVFDILRQQRAARQVLRQQIAQARSHPRG